MATSLPRRRLRGALGLAPASLVLWAALPSCTVANPDATPTPPVVTADAGPPGACDSATTEAGRCDGDKIVYCKDGTVAETDCAQIGATCQSGPEGATCSTTRAEPCGDVTALGTCEGNTIVYCGGDPLLPGATAPTNAIQVNTLHRIPCAAYGQKCDPHAGKDTGADCVSHGPCPSTGSSAGTCSGANLEFCEQKGGSNQLFKFDCAPDQCLVTGGFADCVQAGVADGCGTESADGRCDGNVRVSCLGGVVAREDCAARGMLCKPVGATPETSCQPGNCADGCPTGWSCSAGRCAPASAPTRDWTFMVYIIGDNNLARDAILNLNQMETVGSNAAVQVVSQFQVSRNTPGVDEAFAGGAFRMPMKQDSDPRAVTSVSGATAVTDAMSSGAGVKNFVRWATTTYPAKRYALVMWNHGDGFKPAWVTDGTNQSMTLRNIVDGVRSSGVHMDLLAFDACLMGMHEVGMAFNGLADVMVASEETEPGAGYKYDTMLTALQQAPTMGPVDLGKIIVDKYIAGLPGRALTMSEVDLAKLPGLNKSLAGFAQSATTALPGHRLDVQNALRSSKVIRFTERDNADVFTVASALQSVEGGVGSAAESLDAAIKASGAVIYSRGTSDGYFKDFTGVGGLALFTPRSANRGAFEDYRSRTSFLPFQPWQAFISSFQAADTAAPPASGAVDSFHVVLSWASEPGGKSSKADLDLYVVEPDGGYGTPSEGSVSENGVMSGDSEMLQIPRESYRLKSEHAPGTYMVLAHYYGGTEKAFPQLEIVRGDQVTGRKVLLRAKLEGRALTQKPMDNSAALTRPIDGDNWDGVQKLDYSNVWFATSIEVK